jgi:hypothetical protein
VRTMTLIFALLLAGCGLAPLGPKGGDSADSGAAAAGFEVPPALDFGAVSVGDSVTDGLVVRNNTEDDIGIFAGEISGDASFWVDSTTSFPTTAAAGEELVLNIGFAPTAEQAYTADFTITVQGEAEPIVVSLKGAGGEGGGDDSGGGGDDGGDDDGLTTDLNPIDFQGVYTNVPATQTLTLTNNGTFDVLVSGLAFSDAGVLSWEPTAGENFNLAQVITSGSSKRIDVVFDPDDERVYNETLTIESDDGNKVVQITGEGLEPLCDVCVPTINVTTNSTDSHLMSLFGSILGLPVTEAMTIRNDSDVELELIDFVLVNDTQGGTFSISGFAPQTLGPREQTAGNISYVCPEICVEVPLFGENTLTIESDDPSQGSYEVGLTNLPP